ncbi:hypothetical protein LSTR_LSTR002320 [Laodelphax striatellus]|uniref:Uncharacterized protein n=1 Tax=Laodelphax striatellus TaxID=195883 RepID=A0A482WM30_LAOST|nr:hypothetical protein LSTR_LSTR016207 [Laodelphax striatellus]RZF44547.1 hypothetical protein LSTR_LSTR002320 [Laodelphax striatellus]
MWGEIGGAAKLMSSSRCWIVLATKNEKENNNLDEDGGWKNEMKMETRTKGQNCFGEHCIVILSDETERAGLMFRRR